MTKPITLVDGDSLELWCQLAPQGSSLVCAKMDPSTHSSWTKPPSSVSSQPLTRPDVRSCWTTSTAPKPPMIPKPPAGLKGSASRTVCWRRGSASRLAGLPRCTVETCATYRQHGSSAPTTGPPDLAASGSQTRPISNNSARYSTRPAELINKPKTKEKP